MRQGNNRFKKQQGFKPENNNSNNEATPPSDDMSPLEAAKASVAGFRKGGASKKKQSGNSKQSIVDSMIDETTSDDSDFWNKDVLALMRDPAVAKGKSHIDAYLDAVMSGGVQDGQKFVDMAEICINWCILNKKFTLVEFAKFLEFTNSMEILNAKQRYDINIGKAGEYKDAAPMKKQTEGLETFIKVADALQAGVAKKALDIKCLTWGSILQTVFVVYAMKNVVENINTVSSKVAKWFHNKALWKSVSFEELDTIFMARMEAAMTFIQFALDSEWFTFQEVGSMTNTGYKTQVPYFKLTSEALKVIQSIEDDDEDILASTDIEEYMADQDVAENPKPFLKAGMIPNFRGLGMTRTVRQDKSNKKILQKVAERQATYILFINGDLDDIKNWDLSHTSDFSQAYFKCFKSLALTWRECNQDVFGGNGGADTRTGKMKFSKITPAEKSKGAMAYFRK